MEKRNWFLLIGFVGLTFLVIPLRRKNDSPNHAALFEEYIEKFNKTYKSNESEYMIRMENFKQSLKMIEELNKNRSNNESALYGLTIYADMSQDEFKKAKLQTNRSTPKFPINYFDSSELKSDFEEKRRQHNHRSKINLIPNEVRLKRAVGDLPPMIDWRMKKVIGEVHNQRTCGACWAFSTVETIESMNAIKNGSFLSLSVQEAIDCAGDGNFGCEGGDSCSLLQWLMETETKITTEEAYPFAYHTQACRLKVLETGVQVKSFNCNNYINEEDKMVEKLAYHGPIAAAVNALNWQYYLGGIIQYHCSGETEDMNHAVQIVGYNKTGPVPHYIVRNSWGEEFGDNGYLYIAIGGNVCGIANEVSSVDV